MVNALRDYCLGNCVVQLIEAAARLRGENENVSSSGYTTPYSFSLGHHLAAISMYHHPS